MQTKTLYALAPKIKGHNALVVLSQKQCVKCTQAKQVLTQHDITFLEFDILKNDFAGQLVLELPLYQAPGLILHKANGTVEFESGDITPTFLKKITKLLHKTKEMSHKNKESMV
jgi:glutaredoxin